MGPGADPQATLLSGMDGQDAQPCRPLQRSQTPKSWLASLLGQGRELVGTEPSVSQPVPPGKPLPFSWPVSATGSWTKNLGGGSFHQACCDPKWLVSWNTRFPGSGLGCELCGGGPPSPIFPHPP